MIILAYCVQGEKFSTFHRMGSPSGAKSDSEDKVRHHPDLFIIDYIDPLLNDPDPVCPAFSHALGEYL
jgi:hypothetical protein